jgi:acetoin utilization deacetylase AcuC-like enzyme
VLDIDYHHGNGTQAIFYERATCSSPACTAIRTPSTRTTSAMPTNAARAARACNLNLPLPRGTGFAALARSHGPGAGRRARVRREALVVSLGVDTFETIPMAGFGLRSDDYLRLGEDLAAAGLPTCSCSRAAMRWRRWASTR